MLSPDQYVDEVYRLIQQNFRHTDPTGGMLVAPIASIVHRTVGYKHKGVGFGKFKDVLSLLESRGVIKIGLNQKGLLSLWLLDSKQIPEPSVSVAPPRSRSLKKRVWLAFVSVAYQGLRLFNRTSGEIRIANDRPLGEEWVQIPPVDRDAQRQLARQFLRAHSFNDDEISRLVDQEKWYFNFTEALRLRSTHLLPEWNRELTRHVISAVTNWSAANGIADDLIFEGHEPDRLEHCAATSPQKEKTLKDLILQALAEMPIEELVRLNLPTHRLVAALRPDLMD